MVVGAHDWARGLAHGRVGECELASIQQPRAAATTKSKLKGCKNNMLAGEKEKKTHEDLQNDSSKTIQRNLRPGDVVEAA